MDKCRWIYRQGTKNSHWAMTTCKKGLNFLSRLPDSEPYVGVADWYNGKKCPTCGQRIEIDYSNISD